MFEVVLYEPEIPPNTGNIIRLCANTGCRLHLIGPLGFRLEDRLLRRAGLDYCEWASVRVYQSLQAFYDEVRPTRTFGLSTRGVRGYYAIGFLPGDALVFGPETRGLPESVRARIGSERLLRLPMVPESRSLNLSNSVAIVVYEAWRQQGYTGGG